MATEYQPSYDGFVRKPDACNSSACERIATFEQIELGLYSGSCGQPAISAGFLDFDTTANSETVNTLFLKVYFDSCSPGGTLYVKKLPGPASGYADNDTDNANMMSAIETGDIYGSAIIPSGFTGWKTIVLNAAAISDMAANGEKLYIGLQFYEAIATPAYGYTGCDFDFDGIVDDAGYDEGTCIADGFQPVYGITSYYIQHSQTGYALVASDETLTGGNQPVLVINGTLRRRINVT